MALTGCDYSFGNGVTTAQLQKFRYDAGDGRGKQPVKFVFRYLTGLDGNPKDINATELTNLLGAGFAIGFVYETDGQDYPKSGTEAANRAQAQLLSLANATALPDVASACVYFTQDIPRAIGVRPVIYMRDVCAVLGRSRVGFYGDFTDVKNVIDANCCAKLANGSFMAWQTPGDSGGKWEDRAVLRQLGQAKIGPCEADIDVAAFYLPNTPALAATDDFGQYPTPAVVTPPPPPPPPKPTATRHVADGNHSLRSAANNRGVSVAGAVRLTTIHGTPAEVESLATYLANGNWGGVGIVRLSKIGANRLMPRGLVWYGPA